MPNWLNNEINWNYVPGVCNADSFRFYGGGVGDGNNNAGAYHLDDVHYSNGADGWHVDRLEPGWLFEAGSNRFGGGVVTDLSGRKPKEGLIFLPLREVSGDLGSLKAHGDLGLLGGYGPDGITVGFYGDGSGQLGPFQGGGGGGWSVSFSSAAACVQQ